MSTIQFQIQIYIKELKTRVQIGRARHAVIAVVRPFMEYWLENNYGRLSYRLTQVINGKGCFEGHLYLIRRERLREHVVHHTLAECLGRTEQSLFWMFYTSKLHHSESREWLQRFAAIQYAEIYSEAINQSNQHYWFSYRLTYGQDNKMQAHGSNILIL